MKRRHLLLSAAAVLMLSACGGTWETAYTGVAASDSRNWRVSKININVPRSLSVSEENTYAPEAYIVWRGEPEGDRHAQVAQIFNESARAGTRALRGSRPVTLDITVHGFHALSDKARTQLSSSGVHNIIFDMTVRASNRTILAQEQNVQADLIAYVGEQSKAAEEQGITQRVRIVHHLTNVIQNWFGYGEDMRVSFSRNGR